MKVASLKARMFNRAASNPKNKPGEVLEALGLKRGEWVADIGSGGGFFSLRFAEVVGRSGRVFSVDVDPGMLEFIKATARGSGLANIETVLSRGGELALPERSIDLVFVRNVYHHLTDRVEYFRRLRRFLKPAGRIAIIEYKGVKPLTFRGLFRHYVPRETIIEEMGKAGYEVSQEFTFLPEQSFIIFRATN